MSEQHPAQDAERPEDEPNSQQRKPSSLKNFPQRIKDLHQEGTSLFVMFVRNPATILFCLLSSYIAISAIIEISSRHSYIETQTQDIKIAYQDLREIIRTDSGLDHRVATLLEDIEAAELEIKKAQSTMLFGDNSRWNSFRTGETLSEILNIDGWFFISLELLFKHERLSDHTLHALIVIFCAALGGLLMEYRQRKKGSLHGLILGFSAGLGVFFVIQGGAQIFFRGMDGLPMVYNPYGAALAGFLSGIFTDKVYNLANDIADGAQRGAKKSVDQMFTGQRENKKPKSVDDTLSADKEA